MKPFHWLGIDRLWAQADTLDAAQRINLSEVIGTIVYVLILIPVAIAALNTLDIPAISDPASAMLTSLLAALPAIFGAFLLLAIAYFAARIAIIIFSAALALREMGIAESIVNLAFGLLLGAVAAAADLAFGLGGRDAAARQVDRW
jgi:hypothetical protein